MTFLWKAQKYITEEVIKGFLIGKNLNKRKFRFGNILWRYRGVPNKLVDFQYIFLVTSMANLILIIL